MDISLTTSLMKTPEFLDRPLTPEQEEILARLNGGAAKAGAPKPDDAPRTAHEYVLERLADLVIDSYLEWKGETPEDPENR